MCYLYLFFFCVSCISEVSCPSLCRHFQRQSPPLLAVHQSLFERESQNTTKLFLNCAFSSGHGQAWGDSPGDVFCINPTLIHSPESVLWWWPRRWTVDLRWEMTETIYRLGFSHWQDFPGCWEIAANHSFNRFFGPNFSKAEWRGNISNNFIIYIINI